MNRFNRKILIFLLSGVCFLGANIWAAWFLYSEINQTSSVISEASVHFAILGEKERQFEESSKNLQKYSAEIEVLERTFLNEDTFVDLIRLFEEIAKAAGVKFKASSAKVPTGITDKASLSFELEGQRGPLVRFFILLDHIPYAGIVSNLSWGQLGKGGDDIKVTANFIIFNYVK